MSTRVPPTWRFNLELIRAEPRILAVHSVLHVLFFASRVIPGLLEKGIFDTLSQGAPAWSSLWTLVALYGSVEIARAISELGASWNGWNFRLRTGNRIRSGLFRQSLVTPAASPLPVPSGDAVNRYRDDIGEVTDFPLWLPDALGNIISFAVAVGIMASINLGVTLAVFIPLSATIFVTRVFWRRMLAYRRAVRRYTATVAAFLGEILGAVQAIKVAGREEGVLRHFAGLNEKRRQAAIKDEVLHSLLFSLGESTAVLGVGITLVAASSAISQGTFTVGDFALFVYYLWFAAELPSYLGSFAGDYGEQAVAIERLAELASPAPVEQMVHTGRLPAEVTAPENAGGPLATLEVRGLTYRHLDGGRGIARAGFTVERGTLTAITGRIGSGKSTLLQAMLGLLPVQEGEVLWNGQVIRDPATFLLPPAAHTCRNRRASSATRCERTSPWGGRRTKRRSGGPCGRALSKRT